MNSCHIQLHLTCDHAIPVARSRRSVRRHAPSSQSSSGSSFFFLCSSTSPNAGCSGSLCGAIAFCPRPANVPGPGMTYPEGRACAFSITRVRRMGVHLSKRSSVGQFVNLLIPASLRTRCFARNAICLLQFSDRRRLGR